MEIPVKLGLKRAGVTSTRPGYKLNNRYWGSGGWSSLSETGQQSTAVSDPACGQLKNGNI